MDRYRYSVTPYTPITKLQPGIALRRPFSADLNREEVFLCMKHGPVYRIFPGQNPIRVTGANFESLHVAKPGDIFSEEPATNTEDTVKEQNHEPVVPETAKEEVPTKVEVVPEQENTKTEEVVETPTEAEETEDDSEEVAAAVEESDEVVDDDDDEDGEALEVEDESGEEEEDQTNVAAPAQNHNNQQNYNNKHNKKHKK